jgi:hypothetical protein
MIKTMETITMGWEQYAFIAIFILAFVIPALYKKYKKK